MDGRTRDGKLQGLRAAGRREVAAEAAEQKVGQRIGSSVRNQTLCRYFIIDAGPPWQSLNWPEGE